MQTPKTEKRILLILAVLGLIIPNGIYVYHQFAKPDIVAAALANPVAAVFIAEAFFLMFFFAWLIHRLGFRKPDWIVFIITSLIGGMAFSVPSFLWWFTRRPAIPADDGNKNSGARCWSRRYESCSICEKCLLTIIAPLATSKL